jgi:hypothetical protein
MLEMIGAGAVVELVETLSNVAVPSVEVLPLLATNPIYTFVAMLIV